MKTKLLPAAALELIESIMKEAVATSGRKGATYFDSNFSKTGL